MASVVITVLAAALIVFAVYQTVQKARGKSKMASCCGSGEPVRRKSVADRDASHYPYRYKLAIENMKCSNCAANVENALNGRSFQAAQNRGGFREGSCEHML